MKSNRRNFLTTSAALVGSAFLGNEIIGMPAIIKNLGSKDLGVQLGLITYSFRDMPDQSAEATLQYILDTGSTAVELMGGPAESYAGAPKSTVDYKPVIPLLRKRNLKEKISDDEKKTLADFDANLKAYRTELSKWRLGAPIKKFEKLCKTFKKAGVRIYAFKPDAFGMNNSDADIEYGMRAAKALGASHVTLEHPSNDAHTLKLGKIAEKFGMKVGYHGHEQQTPTFWDTALMQSPANGLNLDFGHFVAAGNTNPLDFVKLKHDHILSMHVKDRQTKAHGGGNLPWGTGDTPIKEVLKIMQANQYKFPATVELEYKIPEGSNAVNEVKKCIEYCKNALS